MDGITPHKVEGLCLIVSDSWLFLMANLVHVQPHTVWILSLSFYDCFRLLKIQDIPNELGQVLSPRYP